MAGCQAVWSSSCIGPVRLHRGDERCKFIIQMMNLAALPGSLSVLRLHGRIDIVTAFEPEHVFEWSVIGRDDDVSSIWRYTMTDRGEGSVDLEFWFQMGPGRGGLNYAIERMPDKEERIVDRRMKEHRLNMERVVAGVKELAESAGVEP
jgi:hypothetical protein